MFTQGNLGHVEGLILGAALGAIILGWKAGR